MGAKPLGDLGEVKGFDPTAFGQSGIGQKDLTELQKRGYTKKAITNYVDSERAKGTRIGKRVDASIDLMGKAPTKKGPVRDFDHKAFGGKGFGFEDVKELANRGYGGKQIRGLMDHLEGQGVNIGPRAGMSIDFMTGKGRGPGRPHTGPKRMAGSKFGMTDGSKF